MLKAGFSRLDVTPPFGTEISGYFTVRISDGILDPLYINTVAVGNGNENLILMAVDYIGISHKYNTEIRAHISEKTGIPSDHIILAALHQHTSISIREAPQNNVVSDHDYMEMLSRKFCDVAQMALSDMSDATFGVAEQRVANDLSL